MTTTSVRTIEPPVDVAPERHTGARLLGAALAIGIAAIHVIDQGGFPGSKTPTYVGVGYYLLEAAGLVAAVALIVGPRRHTIKAWALTVGVALGPFVGYVLSRGPGLPGYTDDRGNWTEPLGVISLVVKGVLLVLAGLVLARSRRAA